MKDPNDNIESKLIECSALGEIVYDTIECLLESYEDRNIGCTGAVMMVIWELITKQLLVNHVDGRKMRVVLMELQDECEQ